jgi:circadian clock protein KaiC
LSTSNELNSAKAATGIEGLDDILAGGLSRGHVFLLEGEPGTGKTTVALHFLRAGAMAGERSLYITLSETERELRQGALSHGWDLASIDIFELTPPESLLDAEQQQQSCCIPPIWNWARPPEDLRSGRDASSRHGW